MKFARTLVGYRFTIGRLTVFLATNTTATRGFAVERYSDGITDYNLGLLSIRIREACNE